MINKEIKVARPNLFNYIANVINHNINKQKGLAMQYTKSKKDEQETKIQTSLERFFQRFDLQNKFEHSNIKKIRGYKVKDIIITIMSLAFLQKNYYLGIIKNEMVEFGKSVAYDLQNNPKYNWRLLLSKVALAVINCFLTPLTSEKRECVLIIDDSSYPRNRSKKVELLARVYDHVKNVFFKGFRMLQLGWSDGNSFVPVDFAMLSSNQPENRLVEMNWDTDRRSCGYQRRKEATSKSTEIIFPMVKRALKRGIKARYLLMDSWFGFPVLIGQLQQLIDVICRVKDTEKIHYFDEGKKVTIRQIYRTMRKRRGNASIKGSRIVSLEQEGSYYQVKIVFVKNKNKKKSWLAILSTDINLPDKEIVRIYGKRWDIEVYFKMMKQCLNLTKEVETRSFDGIIAHATIVMLRYIFLTVEQRDNVDDKTFGGMYNEIIEEMKDITFLEAMIRIMSLTIERLRERDILTDEVIDEIMNVFMGFVIEKYGFLSKAA